MNAIQRTYEFKSTHPMDWREGPPLPEWVKDGVPIPRREEALKRRAKQCRTTPETLRRLAEHNQHFIGEQDSPLQAQD